MASSPPIVLTFAASDPTGGAGLQADLLTLAALGCHPLSVRHRAHGAGHARRRAPARGRARPASREQARALLADMPVAAFKLGVLGSADNVARDRGDRSPSIRRCRWWSIRCSPRGAATRSPSDGSIVALLRERSCRCATVATPNSLEAQRLGGARRAAATLGCRYVLVTGTHDDTRGRRQHALRRERPGARGPLAAPAGQLSRLGLHARLRDRRRARQRAARCPRRCATRRTTPGTRSPPAFAPARASSSRTASSTTDEAARPLRHHARRPRTIVGEGASRRSRAASRCSNTGSKNRAASAAEAQAARSRSRAATACRSSSTTTSSSRSRSAPTACISAATTAISPPRAQKLTGKLLGASCYDRPRPRAQPRSRAGADYVAFGSVFSSPTKPAAVRAPLSLFSERSRRAALRDRRHHAAERAAADRRRRRPARGDLRPVRRTGHRAARGRAIRKALPMKNAVSLRARAARHPGRREFAGARVPRGRRHAAVLRARRGRPPLGRRRQALHRLRRLLGTDARRPHASGGGRGGAGRGRARAVVRRADRGRGRAGRNAAPPGALARAACAWCPPAPRRR